MTETRGTAAGRSPVTSVRDTRSAGRSKIAPPLTSVRSRPAGEIAERLGRHPSIIYRELGRNRFRDGDRGICGYFPLNAQDLARRPRRRRPKLAVHEGLGAPRRLRLEGG